jgi:hypothetical protein
MSLLGLSEGHQRDSHTIGERHFTPCRSRATNSVIGLYSEKGTLKRDSSLVDQQL